MVTENIVLYDLIDTESSQVFFSPFGWFINMALKHKGVPFKHVGLTFLGIKEKVPKLTDKKWDRIPVIEITQDGKTEVFYNSRDIAIELERRYPNSGLGSLFPNGTQFSHFLENYAIHHSNSILYFVFPNESKCLDSANQEYFNSRFQSLLKNIDTDFEDPNKVERLYSDTNKFLAPIAATLSNSIFLEGDKPAYSDYIVFGVMKWLQHLNFDAFTKIIEDNANGQVKKWFDALSELHDGYAKSFNIYRN